MRYIAETTGSFSLLDMMGTTVQEMKSWRPSIVENTPFVQQRIALGQLTVLAELPDEASDADFASYWKESTAREQAIEAYKSKFSPEAESNTNTSTKRRGGRPKKSRPKSEESSE
jgi:hypothetical protein